MNAVKKQTHASPGIQRCPGPSRFFTVLRILVQPSWLWDAGSLTSWCFTAFSPLCLHEIALH